MISFRARLIRFFSKQLFKRIHPDSDVVAVRRLFDAFIGAGAAPDRPDRAALLDNPLVPFGGLDR